VEVEKSPKSRKERALRRKSTVIVRSEHREPTVVGSGRVEELNG
jgi:hypothetical protein